MGICHSYTPDGRCVSLLKILLTNFCVYDCAYCVNRVSSNVQRARFTVDEVVRLTLDFYRRNYIEGLFLSSGIIRSGDYTMEQLVEVARTLREEHRFAGYIHLKTIPDAAPELLAAAGRYADRLSINVELPTEAGMSALAPEKTHAGIHGAMGELKWRIDEDKDARRNTRQAVSVRRRTNPEFVGDGVIHHSDAGGQYVSLALTEKLMMYAINRELEYFDMPQVRAIVAQAAEQDYRLSALVRGIVSSDSFRMQAKPHSKGIGVATVTQQD